MTIEAATDINQLDPTYPEGSSTIAQGDDAIRLIKACLIHSLPNIGGPMTLGHTALNALARAILTADGTGLTVPVVATRANKIFAFNGAGLVDTTISYSDLQNAIYVALGGANFKGKWSTLTGPLNTPASVLHNDVFYVLLNNLADVTLSQPGVTTDWKPILEDAGVVGATRNVRMSLTAASASATLTADEIVVATALGGSQERLSAFNKTINLATVGPGGMDTGTAPVSGFVAIYAIYNPSTATSALLARNAATLQGEVYGGANMPAGYTASALVAVWPTNGSGQLVSGFLENRRLSLTTPVQVLSTSTTQASLTSLSIAAAVPINGKRPSGNVALVFTINAGTLLQCHLAGSSAGLDTRKTALGGAPATINTITRDFSALQLLAAQTLFYTFVIGGGTGQTLNIDINGYEF